MQAELRDAFYTAIAEFADAQELPVAFPNLDFDAANHAKYIKAHTLPVMPTLLTHKGGSHHRWVLQVDVCVRDNTAEIASAQIVDQLNAAYPVGHKFTGGGHAFQVILAPYPANPIVSDGWLSTPVSMRVQTIH